MQRLLLQASERRVSFTGLCLSGDSPSSGIPRLTPVISSVQIRSQRPQHFDTLAPELKDLDRCSKGGMYTSLILGLKVFSGFVCPDFRPSILDQTLKNLLLTAGVGSQKRQWRLWFSKWTAVWPAVIVLLWLWPLFQVSAYTKCMAEVSFLRCSGRIVWVPSWKREGFGQDY